MFRLSSRGLSLIAISNEHLILMSNFSGMNVRGGDWGRGQRVIFSTARAERYLCRESCPASVCGCLGKPAFSVKPSFSCQCYYFSSFPNDHRICNSDLFCPDGKLAGALKVKNKRWSWPLFGWRSFLPVRGERNVILRQRWCENGIKCFSIDDRLVLWGKCGVGVFSFSSSTLCLDRFVKPCLGSKDLLEYNPLQSL